MGACTGIPWVGRGSLDAGFCMQSVLLVHLQTNKHVKSHLSQKPAETFKNELEKSESNRKGDWQCMDIRNFVSSFQGFHCSFDCISQLKPNFF